MWTSQGDLIYRFVRIEESPILKLICHLWDDSADVNSLVAEITQIYLLQHAILLPYSPQVLAKVHMLYRFAWYTLFSSPHESTFDRLIAWHCRLKRSLSLTEKVHYLADVCRERFPLIPVDLTYLKAAAREKVEAYDNEGSAEPLPHT